MHIFSLAHCQAIHNLEQTRKWNNVDYNLYSRIYRTTRNIQKFLPMATIRFSTPSTTSSISNEQFMSVIDILIIVFFLLHFIYISLLDIQKSPSLPSQNLAEAIDSASPWASSTICWWRAYTRRSTATRQITQETWSPQLSRVENLVIFAGEESCTNIGSKMAANVVFGKIHLQYLSFFQQFSLFSVRKFVEHSNFEYPVRVRNNVILLRVTNNAIPLKSFHWIASISQFPREHHNIASIFDSIGCWLLSESIFFVWSTPYIFWNLRASTRWFVPRCLP